MSCYIKTNFYRFYILKTINFYTFKMNFIVPLSMFYHLSYLWNVLFEKSLLCIILQKSSLTTTYRLLLLICIYIYLTPNVFSSRFVFSVPQFYNKCTWLLTAPTPWRFVFYSPESDRFFGVWNRSLLFHDTN